MQIELNQGRNGRTVFHFEKPEPITLKDKDVEFRIMSDGLEIKRIRPEGDGVSWIVFVPAPARQPA